MGISIIIAYHNEGILFIEETVRQIRETADIEPYEIIIVDDYSATPIEISGVTMLRHTHGMGVGAAFDTGIMAAKYDNVIIMGCDIRFTHNGWMSKLLMSIKNNPQSIICTQLAILDGEKKGGLDYDGDKTLGLLAGARLLPFHNKATDHKKTEGFKSILAAQWLPYSKKETGVITVPVVLGALYGIKKEWYLHID